MSTTRTRSRNNNAFSDPPSVNPDTDLPPARQGKATAKHKVSLPGYNVKFSNFVYILSAVALAFIAFKAYQVYQWKSQAGGWWSLAMGKSSNVPVAGQRGGVNDGYDPDSTWKRTMNREDGRLSVEDHIEALATSLGLPSKELAAAIAEAVKNYLPPASLSSVSAAEATATGSGEAVKVLVGEEDEAEPGTGLKDRLSAFSSFDDPVMEET